MLLIRSYIVTSEGVCLQQSLRSEEVVGFKNGDVSGNLFDLLIFGGSCRKYNINYICVQTLLLYPPQQLWLGYYDFVRVFATH